MLNGGTADAWVKSEQTSIDEELVRRIADPDDDLGHADVVDDLLLEYTHMQKLIFEEYASRLETLTDCVKRARPEKSNAAVRRSVFSLCLQNEEDRIMQAMEAFLEQRGYPADVLVYDGCLVRRCGDGPFPEPLLRGCERAVRQETGYRIELAEKCLRCEVVCSKCKCKAVSEEAPLFDV